MSLEQTVEGRRAALAAMEERALEGDTAALASAIESFLSDDDWRVRKDAASLAARYLDATDRDGTELALRLARAVLQGEDVGLRNAAIEALATAGTSPARHRAVHEALSRMEEGAPHTALKFLCAAWVGGGPLALPRLSHHARDVDSTTATAALEALARIGGRGAEDELAAVLFTQGEHGVSDDVVRLAALEGLVALRARTSAPQLLPLLDQPLFRRPAVRALGFTADRAAVRPLVDRLASPRLAGLAAAALSQLCESDELARIVAEELAGLGEPSRGALLEAAASEDENVSRPSLAMLLLAREPRALARTASFSAHDEPGRVLLEALKRFGADAVSGLLAAVSELDPPAAAWALEAAAELAEASGRTREIELVRAALRQALSAPSEGLKIAALRGLSRFGEGKDAVQLVALGARGSSHVAAAASEAIAALSTNDPQALESALEGNEAPLAWSKAVRALPRPLALEKVSEAASGEDPSARRAAIEALVYVGGDEAAELAAVALADEDESVRLAAVRTLAELAVSSPDGRAAGALRMALRSSEPPVRAAAVRAASEHDLTLDAEAILLAGDPTPEVLAALFFAVARGRTLSLESRARLLPHVEQALAHEDDGVVKSALVALASLRPEGLTDALAHALSHRAWDVRLEAARLAHAELERASHDSLERDALERGGLKNRGAKADALRRVLASRRSLEDDDLVRAAIDAALSGWGDA